MTRHEQLKFCRVCTHHEKDLNRGILCSLTGDIATFEETCTSYVQDPGRNYRGSGKGWSTGVYLNTASKGKRFTNFIIDRIVLLVLSLGFGIFLGVVLALVSPAALTIMEEGNFLMEYFLAFVFGTIYYSLLEGLTGRSVGKLITKTRVVNEEGGSPSFSSVFLRSLCRYIPFDAFSFLGDDAIGWHDTLSKTRVIEIED
jgi:uncharacterized RDD family membrane protein YckC